MKILKINSSVQPLAQSASRQLVEKIIDQIGGADAEIIDRDLTQGVSIINGEMVGAFYTPAGEQTDRQKEILKESDQYVQELKDADTVIVAVPMYNFGVPGSLKAYFDLVARVGLTFKYTDQGPQDLLENKQVFVVVTSGGVGVGAPVDFASGHVQTFFSFIGLSDVTIIDATQLMADREGQLAKATAQIETLTALV